MNIGEKFNRLTVIEFLDKGKVYCECDCGNFHITERYNLKNNRVTSCGCYKKQGFRRKHGAKSNGKVIMSEYYSWQGMRARCLNPNHSRYNDYGGRGIKICKEWDDFEVFLADMGAKPSIGYSLERLDVNGDYTPENCVWADDITQSRNRRVPKNNKSGVTGVGWNKNSQKWRARITVNGKSILIGHFDEKENAIRARKEAELKYW